MGQQQRWRLWLIRRERPILCGELCQKQQVLIIPRTSDPRDLIITLLRAKSPWTDNKQRAARIQREPASHLRDR